MTQVISTQHFYRPNAVFLVTCSLVGECAPIGVIHLPTITGLSCHHCRGYLGDYRLDLTTGMGLFSENPESDHVVKIVPVDIWLREIQT